MTLITLLAIVMYSVNHHEPFRLFLEEPSKTETIFFPCNKKSPLRFFIQFRKTNIQTNKQKTSCFLFFSLPSQVPSQISLHQHLLHYISSEKKTNLFQTRGINPIPEGSGERQCKNPPILPSGSLTFSSQLKASGWCMLSQREHQRYSCMEGDTGDGSRTIQISERQQISDFLFFFFSSVL